MEKFRRIGVLTSGGDAPGMNAAIRAVTRAAFDRGVEVMGIYRGYSGLIDGDIKPLGLRDVSNIINHGGTILYSDRCPEFKTEEGMQKAIATCRAFHIDGIVAIGGDGTFRGALDLSNEGMPTIGIPGTIDNDIACSDYTIGFDTAANVAIEAVDRLRDTSTSHDRCSVVEVMGHNAGHLALEVGVASGALAVLVPERSCDLDSEVFDVINRRGRSQYIVIVAEGSKVSAHEVTSLIEEKTGMTARLTVLGHIQRGGSPTARDRVAASRMGYRAVDLLRKGIGNRVVCIKRNEIVDYDIGEALSMHKTLDMKLDQVCRFIAG